MRAHPSFLNIEHEEQSKEHWKSQDLLRLDPRLCRCQMTRGCWLQACLKREGTEVFGEATVCWALLGVGCIYTYLLHETSVGCTLSY